MAASLCLMPCRRSLAQTLFERNPDPVLLAPFDLTAMAGAVAGNQQIELGGNVQRGRDFEGGTGLRDIPHHTVHGGAAKFQGGGLEHALPRRAFIFPRQKRLLDLGFLRGWRPLRCVPCCDRDIFCRQSGSYSCPGEFEPKLAVLEVDGRPPVVGRRRLTIEVAAPPPMRTVELPHDSADGQPAPD